MIPRGETVSVDDLLITDPEVARRTTSGRLPGLAHLHHNEGEIVVLLRVTDPVFHLGGNPSADLVGWKVSGLAEQLLQAFIAELLVFGVMRLGDAVGKGEEDIGSLA
jgi:hypothetical protein